MICPKCHAISDERFCAECGLDLQIYDELAAIKRELEFLRSQINANSTPNTESVASVEPITAKTESERRISPPPLPVEIPKHQAKASESKESFPEVAIGQKWLLAIGVFVLIIGIGFFLKYAFDQQWIGPAFRITIGFCLGVVLLVAGNICHRRGLRGLDIGIGAVGLGALYLTSYAAAQFFRLLPEALALLVILITTVVGSCLALAWASQALAILAFIGGYLAPILLPVFHVEHLLFLGYLGILTLGGQALSLGRNWKTLSFSDATLTWLILADFSWPGFDAQLRSETILFTHALFAIYSILPFAYAALKKKTLPVSIYALALANCIFCCYYVDYLLQYEKWPTAFVYLGYSGSSFLLAFLIWRRIGRVLMSGWLVAQALVLLLFLFADIFPSDTKSICASAALVLLYWVAASYKDTALLTITFCVGLILFLGYFYNRLGFNLVSLEPHSFTAGMIGRWLAGLSVASAFLCVSWLDRNCRVAETHHVFNRAFEFLGVGTLFGFANLELLRFMNQFMRQAESAGFSALWSVFAVGLMVVGIWMRRAVYRACAISLLFLTLIKVLVSDTAEVSTPYRILSCAILGMVLLAVSFAYHRYSARLIGK
jgi:uncharacterized membrane protein